MIAALIITLLFAGFGLLLATAHDYFRVEHDPLVEQINALLPQTQCGQCRFAGCRPYAEAIASASAEINRCPPGGDSLITKLAELLDVKTEPLNLEYGVDKPPQVARVIESECIGCTLCIQACPVDAIIGAAQQMHTVITAECTGCELCLPPCPVDCIALERIE